MNSCPICRSKPGEKIFRHHGVIMDKHVCADCFNDMVEPLFITINFSDFTEGTD